MRLTLTLLLLLCSGGLFAQAGEIDVEYSGNSIPDGGQADIGTVDLLETFELQFTIQNEGLDDLNITGDVTITDEDNCGAVVSNQPGIGAIPPAGQTTFNVRVTNDGGGQFSCDINIPNDDLDEGSYAIQIRGVAVADDTDDDDHDDCSTGAGTGSALVFAGLGATGALLYRNRRRKA